ncbi:MAG TPA: transposase, partial [Thermodesulfobacteriota bacterium]|nr:transposase [Thermodesulfobacteriota bacterium]
MILDGIEAAYRASGNRGIWIADRGYDNKKLLDCLLGHKREFVIRVKIDPKVSRDIRDEKGTKRRLSTVAWRTKIKYSLSDYGGKGKIRFGFSKPITLPHRDEPLTLVVYIHVGADQNHQEPVAVLANIKVEAADDAARVVEHYISRWSGCEDPIRFLKQIFRMEKFLIDGMSAIRAWFFFISVAFSILFEIESWGKILECMLKLSQSFATDVSFRYYRIIRGLK